MVSEICFDLMRPELSLRLTRMCSRKWLFLKVLNLAVVAISVGGREAVFVGVG